MKKSILPKSCGAMIMKQAWIDEYNRIISFQHTQNSVHYAAGEDAFWDHIMQLVQKGYRLQ